MAPEQDWCLECGAAATTRVVRPPGWRVPLIVGLAVLALLGAALAIAVGSLSDKADRAAGGSALALAVEFVGNDADRAAAGPPTTRQPPPARHALPAAHTSTAGPQSVPGAAAATATPRPVPLWPHRRQAYSVVVPAGGSRPAAEKQARRLIRAGRDAGILQTDGYDFFTPGSWVVWVGHYPDRPSAESKLPAIAGTAPGAYVTLVRPRQGGGSPTG